MSNHGSKVYGALAKQLFDAYAKARTLGGDPVDATWHQLSQTKQKGWLAAAEEAERAQNAATIDLQERLVRTQGERNHFERKLADVTPAVAPVPMRLNCPDCGELHIDEGEFATKPHHTHSCQHCGLTWRPAVVATVGVQFLPGFKNP